MLTKIIYIITSKAYAISAYDSNLQKFDPLYTSESDPSATFYTLISGYLSRMTYFLGGFALLGLLYAGFLYVTSIGDATKMEQAKKSIGWVVTGILAVTGVFIAIRLIGWIASGVIMPG